MRKFAKSIKKYSKESGIKPEILQKVYNRGVGAYYNNPESVRPNVKSPVQWANARVRSFIEGSKKHDLDLRKKINKTLKELHYEIEPEQKRNAKKLGVEIYPSSRKGKKIDIYKPIINKKGSLKYMDLVYITSIGDINYLDYYKYLKEYGPVYANIRKRLYNKRHKNYKKGSKGYYAKKILWT